jgi:hypothetical protein
MHRGDHNEEVKFLQIALMILGFLAPIQPGGLGYFGAKTAHAVGEYQKTHGIDPVPDSCGPLTRASPTLLSRHARNGKW